MDTVLALEDGTSWYLEPLPVVPRLPVLARLPGRDRRERALLPWCLVMEEIDMDSSRTVSLRRVCECGCRDGCSASSRGVDGSRTYAGACSIDAMVMMMMVLRLCMPRCSYY